MVTEVEAEPSAFLVAVDPWLSQGDIFESVKVPANGDFGEGAEAPALLITHGCALDKKTRKGELTLERLNFLPLENVAALTRDRQAALRSNPKSVHPSEALYLGEVPTLNFEAFVLLSQPFTLAAASFVPLPFGVKDSGGNVVDTRLSCGSDHKRLARLSDEHVEVFCDKMNAFWTRRIPRG